MNNKDFDRLMEEALHIPIPEGLAGRLEKRIDAYALREKRHKTRRFYGITGLAAVALLCVGIFLQTSLQRRQPADTFTDPAEAAAAAGQALAYYGRDRITCTDKSWTVCRDSNYEANAKRNKSLEQ